MWVWNWPALPVMPWVMPFVSLPMRMLMEPGSLFTGHRGDNLLRRVGHVVGGDDRKPRCLKQLLAKRFVGAFHAHNQRDAQLDFPGRGDDAFGDGVAAHDSAEDIDQNPLDLAISKHQLECLGHFFSGGPA